MANTYTQIYIQMVFVVQGRENLIKERNREQLEKYISGVVTQKKSKVLAIYCNPDHTHVLIGVNPAISISDMGKHIKTSSSRWINENKWVMGRYTWQVGFGAFSYSKSQIVSVAKYIRNQPLHHKNRSFRDEYLNLLSKFEIDYDDKYLFEWL